MITPIVEIVAYALPVIVIAGLFAASVRVLLEYERGVVFTLGRVGRKAAYP